CPGVLMGQETVVIDKDGYPIISEILCTGCGICPKKCPANCITIINLVEEVGRPIYQYGVNMFRLYGLAIPKDEGVVGFLGKNGIGKSTALHILAGIIIPNFAEYEKDWDYDKVIKNLGPLEQHYFKQLKEKKLKVSLKPQNIEKIKSVFVGTAYQLLKNLADEQKIKEVSKIFELDQILERNVAVLSGGELQRLALAAAYIKEADLYYFDEPASYLDIEQRLKVAKIIKELSKDKKVIVIEHDLALFDYLVDYVYVFFGQENAYGIVSKIKNSRVGINQYLEGFLKEENIRFRDYEIKFRHTALEQPRNEILLAYPSFSKTFENFSFKTEEGKIYQGEVIGIIGKNSLGKTLFADILAGKILADQKLEEKKLKISYKPQHIKAVEGLRVIDYISQNIVEGGFFQEICTKLNINSIAEKSLDQLSGGELQRVEIARALATNADLYLLDEPSAFLDVEQRLFLASLIQRLISNSSKACFVIDHDLILIDAISNRLIVFEGQSSKYGQASSPLSKIAGFNRFLKGVGITLRRDKDSFRPKINKPGSRLDIEQKEKNSYYFIEGENV
ncbi:MAG: ribosome biogenesis/translation initiation ATPase RLI, partial [Candidatus Micrarchaeota archaeon]|nr:ribosome biogenesis/translation initiation ATPase RLI [Candidatus Micrarchaeota archaeon]